jgi:hypothetical protein
MRISKTKQTRKGSRAARRSTPPFSPLLGMLGGVNNNFGPPINLYGNNNTAAPKAEETPEAGEALKGFKQEYAKQVSELIETAKLPTTLKLLKCILYGIQTKEFSKDIKSDEYELLTPENIQKGIETGTLQEAQQAIAAALWKKLILTLAE